MHFVLSPIGTSILTNQAGEDKGKLYQYANAIEKNSPPEIISLIEQLKDRAEDVLKKADITKLRKSSAELNGIIGLYDEQLPEESDDIHFLIVTETYQGQVAAEVLQKFLNKHFPTVQVFTPFGLNTADKSSFEQGIKDLLKWCDETLPGYRHSGTEIIFNLTGGFKSLQGYLNTIGMFYADRITYIFETGKEVINIPRLPIHLEEKLFENYAGQFLQLSQSSDGVLCHKLADIPSVMLDQIDDHCLLSTWGTLAWNNAKEAVLDKSLIALPMIAYEDSFKRDFEKSREAREKVKLQETIAKVSCLLQENSGDPGCLRAGRGGGILYDNFLGKNSHLGHFRLGKGPRISCEYKNRTLHLRHFGSHDYVNNNP